MHKENLILLFKITILKSFVTFSGTVTYPYQNTYRNQFGKEGSVQIIVLRNGRPEHNLKTSYSSQSAVADISQRRRVASARILSNRIK